MAKKTKKKTSEPKWHETLAFVKNYVVSVKTPNGSGTGFLITSSKTEKVVGIATASHVVDYAHEWGQPIKIGHYLSGEITLLKESDRSVHWDPNTDSALIRFPKGKLPLSEQGPYLIERGLHMKEGVEIGWCGFPAVYPSKLCFFSGRVSAWLKSLEAYLIDGVAINGVSGGPAFSLFGEIIGMVTAYIPNKTLPGVALVRSLTTYLNWLEELKPMPTKAESDSPVPPKLENAPSKPKKKVRNLPKNKKE